jgi:predicted aconitase with swiveling domain
VTGTVLLVPEAIGSSSSSAIMLELIRNGVAPAAVLMGRADAILALGVVVAGELGYATLPVVEIPLETVAPWSGGRPMRVHGDGRIAAEG